MSEIESIALLAQQLGLSVSHPLDAISLARQAAELRVKQEEAMVRRVELEKSVARYASSQDIPRKAIADALRWSLSTLEDTIEGDSNESLISDATIKLAASLPNRPTPTWPNGIEEVMAAAVELSTRLRHGYIDLEHILYGLAVAQETRSTFEDAGATPDAIAEEIERFTGSGSTPFTSLSLTLAARQLLSELDDVSTVGLARVYFSRAELLKSGRATDIGARMLFNLDALKTLTHTFRSTDRSG